ncbi:hypothetical protein GGI09_005132 [Coemansia sp. S100]|nr:hypothetical protein LPJ71_006164 [Coemansia sp. S17]KAJ2094950.1 hypothetical protein GGI09_005132 [Coemansia sp. S100]
MDLRLLQIKRTVANVSDEASSELAKKYKHANLWPEIKLADSSERTATWSRAEKERVFELLQAGLTSPLMITKHMGKTKSLRQVAEFLEYLQVSSTVVGSDDDTSADSESGDTEDSSESESSESEHEAVATRLKPRSRPASDKSTSGSSSSSSESSSDSEADNRRMGVASGDGFMSVESASSSSASEPDSDIVILSSESDASDSFSSSADDSDESSSSSESGSTDSTDSGSSSDSDDVSVVSDNDQSIAREERLALAAGAKRDKETRAFNRHMFKLFRKESKKLLYHYNDTVLFDSDYGDVIAKLIHGDDHCTVDQATYAEMQLAVIHFVLVIMKDAIARQTITRGAIQEGSNTVSRTNVFQCIAESLDSSRFPPRKPVNELYDGLLRKYLDEDTYDELLGDESAQ